VTTAKAAALFEAADPALYRVRQTRRNCVEGARAMPPKVV